MLNQRLMTFLCLLFLLNFGTAISQTGTATFLMVFGTGEVENLEWDGHVAVTGGRLVDVQPWMLDSEDEVTAAGTWNFRSPITKRSGRFAERLIHDIKGVIVTIDGTESTRLQVSTAQGDFSFKPSDVSAGSEKWFLNRACVVRRSAVTAAASTREYADDQPSLAVDSSGEIWMGWAAYREGGQDVICVRKNTSDGLGPIEYVTPQAGDYYKTAMSVDDQGQPWIVWAARRDNNFDLFGSVYSDGQWSDAQQLTNHPQPDIHQVMTTASDGTMWLVWQSFRTGNADIFARSYSNDRWSEPIPLTHDAGNDWEPAIASDNLGRLCVVWDTYRHGDYDVYLKTMKDGIWSAPMPVTNSPAFEARASVTADGHNSFWISWEIGHDNWGKDHSGRMSLSSPRENAPTNSMFRGLGMNVGVGLARFKDGQFARQIPPLSPSLTGELHTVARDQPQRMHLAADGSGRPWLFFRYRRSHMEGNNESHLWVAYGVYLQGDKWSAPIYLPLSNGDLPMAVRATRLPGNRVAVVFSGDRRRTVQPREGQGYYATRHNDVFFTTLTTADNASPNAAGTFTQSPHVLRSLNSPVSDVRRFQIRHDGIDYRVYWGDLHRHTTISWDGSGYDGTMEALYRYGIDAGEMDFVAVTDHQYGYRDAIGANRLPVEPARPIFDWWQTQKLADVYHAPGIFAPLFGYERTLGFPHGHRNVINWQRGYLMVPYFRADNGVAIDEDEEMHLWDALRGQEAITIPHTPASGMGTNWAYNDSKIETVVELYQGYRVNYEYAGAPLADTGDDPLLKPISGGIRPDGYVWNALAKGYRLGFIASSDHFSTNLSYAAVYAQDFSRESIFKGLQSRRTYAASDKILLDVRLNGHLMGEEFVTQDRPRLDVHVRGTDTIQNIDIIKDNAVVYSMSPESIEASFTYIDREAETGNSYYYVRVIQNNKAAAWGSPFWVTWQLP